MGQAMRLEQAIDRIGPWGDDDIICVRKPWQPGSDAIVVVLDDNDRVPESATDGGHAYFLEVTVAREVLDVFANRATSLAERTALLIHDAEHDAYPGWVYDEA